MILASFFAALAQLGDVRFRSVLLKGLALTVGVFVAIYVAFVWLVGWLVGDSVTLPWIGQITWVDTAISWGAVPLMLLLSVVLMVPVASAITSFFLDEVAQRWRTGITPHLARAATCHGPRNCATAPPFWGC